MASNTEAQVLHLLYDSGAEFPHLTTRKIMEIFYHNNRKKLSTPEVRALRALSRTSMTQRELAYMFQINPATVSRIISGAYHS